LQYFYIVFLALKPSVHITALKMSRKVSHLNIAFDRYASVSIVMHDILVIR